MKYVDLGSVPGLTDAEHISIRQHYALSADIVRTWNVLSFLIKDVHAKRGKKDSRGIIRLKDLILRKMYDKILFCGKQSLSSSSAYPCLFRGKLNPWI
jgi:hypothetical protein